MCSHFSDWMINDIHEQSDQMLEHPSKGMQTLTELNAPAALVLNTYKFSVRGIKVTSYHERVFY